MSDKLKLEAGDGPGIEIADDSSIYVIARHDSLRRSLVMLLWSFGLKAYPFQTVASFLDDQAKETRGRKPDCVIIDSYRLDLPIQAFLDALDKYGIDRPVLLLESSDASVERWDIANLSSPIVQLTKPYESGKLISVLGWLTGRQLTS